MILWLDDVREPWKHGFIGAEWVKTAAEAIECLKLVEWSSLRSTTIWPKSTIRGIAIQLKMQKVRDTTWFAGWRKTRSSGQRTASRSTL